MSQSLSEEEFARLQSQLIELKTSNYSHEEQARRHNAEMSQLRDRVSQLDRELQKANKIIGKSKKAKDVSGLVDENEGLQRKIHTMEEEYQLQNRTLMAELSKVCSDNEHLKMKLMTAGVDVAALQEGISDSSSDKDNHLESVAELESQVRRLQAENAVFQKTLEANRERHEQEINDMKRVIESLKTSRNQSLLARSPVVVKRFASEHDSESCDTNEVEESDVMKGFDCFLDLVAEKGRQWHEENDQEGNQSGGLDSFLNLIQSEVHKLKDQINSCLEKAISVSQDYEDGMTFDSSELSAAQDEVQRLSEANSALRQEIREKEGLQINLESVAEERRLLQEKLKFEQENSHSTVRQLETELEKMSDKLKKKQESLLQLQEEKEQLYIESQTTLAETVVEKDRELEVLMQQSAKVQEELDNTNAKYREFQLQAESTVQQLRDSLTTAESQAKGNTEVSEKLVDDLRREREAIVMQLESQKSKSTMLEREVHDLRSQVSESVTATEELQNRNASLAQQTGELKAQLEESQNVCQSLLEQRDTLTEEKNLAVQELDRATKLAEKRKTMVDELSIQSQHEAEEVQKQLKTLQSEHEAVIHKLKIELQSEQEKRQGLLANVQQHEMAEKELGKLREKLTATEEEKEELEKQFEQAVADGKQAVEDVQKEVETLKAEVASSQQEKTELENRMTAQEQAIHDKEAEMKLSGKKGAALMKDLKRQLQQEKRHCERLQEQLTEVQKMKPHDDSFSLSAPGELFRPPSRDGSLSSLTGSFTASSLRESVTTQSSYMPLITDETATLLAKVAELKEENWSLEEKVRHLETNASCLAEDVMQKSAIIQQHYMDVKDKVGDVMPSPKQSRSAAKRVLGGLTSSFRSGKEGENQKEVIAKMQRVLEETLMKNIHLQKNLEQLVEELNQTQKENNRLKERLGIEAIET